MTRNALTKPIHDLLCQALETELGGVAVYRMAVMCAHNEDLLAEWNRYLRQTERHVSVLRSVFEAFGLDPDTTTPGRSIVRDKGQALVSAMRKALKDAPDAAQIVAAECIVDAETKDHQNWELLTELARTLPDEWASVLTAACEDVEDEEDEHLYHTRGWCRELWLDRLSLHAQLPPPEEERDVRSGVAAARIEQDRKSAARGERAGR